MEEIDRLRDDILREIGEAVSPEALEAIRVAALGRRGRLTELMRGLGTLAPEARREAGAALNTVKDEIAAALAEAAERPGPASRAGPLLPRRSGRDALADVPPGRGPGHRSHHPYGPSERLPHRVLPRLFRCRGSAGALPPQLFPVHRAVGRGRYRLLAPGRRIED